MLVTPRVHRSPNEGLTCPYEPPRDLSMTYGAENRGSQGAIRSVRTILQYSSRGPNDSLDLRLYLERVTRIELALSAWEADVLPLNYTRGVRPELTGAPPRRGAGASARWPTVVRVPSGTPGSPRGRMSRTGARLRPRGARGHRSE